jgi:hypothetical protein
VIRVAGIVIVNGAWYIGACSEADPDAVYTHPT